MHAYSTVDVISLIFSLYLYTITIRTSCNVSSCRCTMCQDHQLLASSMTWDPKIVTQDCETKPGSVPNIASFPSPFLSCFCFLVRLLCEIPVFAGYVPETIIIMINHNYWLVVSTPLKNISQLGLLFPIYGKNKKIQTSPPF